MKKYLILATLALAPALSAQTLVSQTLTTNWSGSFPNSGVVPDNDPSGLAVTETISGWSGTIANISVTLNLTGGWNGDIYGYLYHDGVMSILLNRVGTPANNGLGYGDSGFNVTLSDTAPNSIHNYQADSPTIAGGVLQGSWQPDGATFAGFAGLSAAGDWTLFLADLNPGGVMTLNNWGLTVVTTPEPGVFALAGLGGLSALLFTRWRK